MFTFRLWRRIHRPFLFLLFGWSSLLLLTKVSIVSTVSPDASSPSSLVVEDLESSIIAKMGIGEEKFVQGNELRDQEELVPAVPQLPFCGGQKKRSTRTESTFESHFATIQNNETGSTEMEDSSEEIVLPPRMGRHIVVGTLDGRVSVLDSMGKILWSVYTGHLFSSTISSLQLSDRGKYIKLIPSLTGGLYRYDGESLEAMPMNADSLLKRSFKLAQDVVITGGKEYRTFGVDIDSGLVKYECGMSGCKSPTTADVTADDSPGIVLVIKKTLQTVRAIDATTGIERWNFSVGTHELALAGVTDGCYEAAADLDELPDLTPHKVRMIIPEGIIFGTDEENRAVWKHKFDSPISQAWILEDQNLKILDPIKANGLLEDPPSLYVGMHRQQHYVQESHVISRKMFDVMAVGDSNGSDFNTEQPLQIAWRPGTAHFPPVRPGRPTPTPSEEQGVSNALAPLYFGPFFVYDRDAVVTSTTPPAIEAPPPSRVEEEEGEDIEEVNMNGDSVDVRVIMAVTTLWFWWKEILGISLLTAVILNVILLRPVVYLTRRRTIAEIINQLNLYLHPHREQTQQLALPAPSGHGSTSSDTLEASTPINHLRVRTLSSSSAISTHSDELQLVPFISQYLKEFDPVQCLGRGAFGTVFEAKKKIDDRSYAVKRIALPNREKSRDRVMREVKALARLDHKNIVRYFNAWIESPPSGWLEKNDPLWNAFILHSPYTSSDPFESKSRSVLTSTSAAASPRKRREHSEIAVLDTPDSDSYIVFEQESIREASDSGITFLPRTSSVQSPIPEEECDGSDWSNWEDDEGPLLPVTATSVINSCETNSKFFRRPTTLDIPSSGDTTTTWGDGNPSESDAGPRSPSSSNSSIMYLYIQQELCQKKTLQDWLRTEKNRSVKQVMVMFAQLVEAVDYIHANKLIHRDLKPGNIFLAEGNGSSPDSSGEGRMTVKIGDFGLATTLAGGEPGGVNGLTKGSRGTEVEEDNNSKQTPNFKLTGQVGTQLYMAPEQFQLKAPYDHKVDIFSLGLIFFELLVPFSTDMEKHTELHKLRQMKFPAHFIKAYPDQFELIQDMVSHDPNSRPDASEIKTYLYKLTTGEHFSTLRSRSYPEHLVPLPRGNVRTRDKESRLIYKTHSAM